MYFCSFTILTNTGTVCHQNHLGLERLSFSKKSFSNINNFRTYDGEGQAAA